MADTLERLQSALPDRYRIEHMLDRGGMAAVFLAQDLKYHPPRRVAIKVLDSGVAEVVGSERFLREIDTVAGLTHPHILPLFDSGAAGGLLYYVMPYVEGESLRRRLEREKQLPLEDALQIAHEVADALEEAHRRGIVHRDVKPENVLLESGHAVVADFGIARAVATADTDRLTTSGITVGTPAYMSPEQMLGGGELDGRSDQYALGCVLYEMLAGVPPFTGSTSESLVHQHLNVAPRPVTDLRPTVPAGVERVLSKALAKIPADRYPTTADFAAALSHARESISIPVAEPHEPGAPIPPGPPPAPTATPKPRFPMRARVGMVTVLVIPLAAALWLWLGPGWPGRPSLAVLDFENATGDTTLGYLGIGLAADVGADLVQRARLNVSSIAEARRLAPEKRAPRSAARALGVRTVLTGSLQPSPAGTRLEVELVNGRSGFAIWSKGYDLSPAEAFRIRNEITAAVASRLGAGIGGAGARDRRYAPPTEAYEEYLRGVEALDDFDDPLAPARAAAVLERAVTLAPGFALGWAARARALTWRYEHEHDPTLLAEAERSADQALELEPDLVQGRVARARIYRSTNRMPAAMRDLDAVLRVNPNWDDAWVEMGRFRRKENDFARAEACCRQAVELRPGYARNWIELAICLQFNGRYDDARAAYQKVIELAPDQNRGYEGVATVYLMQNRFPEAIAVLEKLPRGLTDAVLAENIASAYFFTGRYTQALPYFLLGVSIEPRTAVYHGNLGDCYVRLNRTADARAQYVEAVKLDEADLQISPDDPSKRTDLVMHLAKAGDCDRSWAEYEGSEALKTKTNSEILHQLAKAFAMCGRRPAAISALRRMVELGASPDLFLNEDEFASLRGDPGFQALTAKRAR